MNAGKLHPDGEEARRALLALPELRRLDAVAIFGSMAHGRVDDESDVDVAVVGTEEACQALRAGAPEAIAGRPVQIVTMHEGNGYQRPECWGLIGCEAVHGGRAFWEARGRWAWLYGRHGSETMGMDEVAEDLEMVLRLTTDAVGTWTDWERASHPVELSLGARQSAEAGELLVKLALAVRGFPSVRTHRVKEVVERSLKEGRRPGPHIVDETLEEAARVLREMAKALNGHTEDDHQGTYRERRTAPSPETVARLRTRVGELVRYAEMEANRLEATSTMAGLRERIAPRRAALARTAEDRRRAAAARRHKEVAALAERTGGPGQGQEARPVRWRWE